MTDLIAEDLLLLLLDDQTGKLTHTTYLDSALGGALLMELALAGAVEVHKKGAWSSARVRATTTAPRDDELLTEALSVVAEKERTAQALVDRLGRKRRERLLRRLEAGGSVTSRDETVLGVFARTRWPAASTHREHELRARLGDVLLRGVDADERTAALVALLHALGVAHKVVDREGLPAGEVKRRAKEVADGDWAAQAVRDAIQATQSAVAAVAVVGGTAAAAGG